MSTSTGSHPSTIHTGTSQRPRAGRDTRAEHDEVAGTQNWSRRLDEDVDLLPYFFRLTIDSATEFLFGESVNSQLRLLPGYQSSKMGSLEAEFARAFDAGQMALATRSRFMDTWWLYDSIEFRKSCKIVHDFVDHFVQLALSKDLRRSSLEKDGTAGKDKYIP